MTELSNSNISILITSAIALAAIISPVITTAINNHYQLKIKKLDIKQEEFNSTVLYKKTIFESYLKYACSCTFGPTNENLYDYGEYYALAFLYAPIELQTEMAELHNLFLSYNWEIASQNLNLLIPKITLLIDNLYKEHK